MPRPTWFRHFFYKKEVLKSTWKLRLVLAGVLLLITVPTRSLWTPSVGNSLTCEEQVRSADAILVDDFDRNYLLFERAAALYNARRSSRVLILVPTLAVPTDDGRIIDGAIADFMIRIAHLKTTESVLVQEVEPISLNAAVQVRDYLMKEGIKSIMVVTSGFRAKRALLIYDEVLGRIGIAVSCVPVFGTITPETWTHTWHGIQEVGLQFLKLQYYRFYVLPFEWRARRQSTRGDVAE